MLTPHPHSFSLRPFTGEDKVERSEGRTWTAAHHPRKDNGLSILRDINLNIRTRIKHIWPAQPCVLCGTMSREGVWCAACDSALPYLDAPHCPTCALPTPTGEVCGQCLIHPPLFIRTTAVFGYGFPLDKLIHAMKYQEQLVLAHAFAAKLTRRIGNANLPDFVIPMPLHPAKLRERGFNQSLLLAAKASGMELSPENVKVGDGLS